MKTAVKASMKDDSAEGAEFQDNIQKRERNRERKGKDERACYDTISANISTPRTPPDRIYMELEKMAASRYQNRTLITEEIIVDMIKKWRVGNDMDSDLMNGEIAAKKVDISPNKPLKWDNIAPETVIETIKEYCANEKIKYDRYEEPEDVFDVIVYR
ncbi:unnamed protein product [Rhizophagus irregularis]|nr:hypothetical protein RhiirB3_532013 [Rhizophagus irregularis]CAB4473447.1 unnamed protein product [Rhizophagus irregularis]CAB5194237.1 unnamed protein product [Rhizophagus irregularis]